MSRSSTPNFYISTGRHAMWCRSRLAAARPHRLDRRHAAADAAAGARHFGGRAAGGSEAAGARQAPRGAARWRQAAGLCSTAGGAAALARRATLGCQRRRCRPRRCAVGRSALVLGARRARPPRPPRRCRRCQRRQLAGRGRGAAGQQLDAAAGGSGAPAPEQSVLRAPPLAQQHAPAMGRQGGSGGMQLSMRGRRS